MLKIGKGFFLLYIHVISIILINMDLSIEEKLSGMKADNQQKGNRESLSEISREG